MLEDHILSVHEDVGTDKDQQVLKLEAVHFVAGVSFDSVESVHPAVYAAIKLLLLEVFVELSEVFHHELTGFLQLREHLVGDLQVSDGTLTLAELWHSDHVLGALACHEEKVIVLRNAFFFIVAGRLIDETLNSEHLTELLLVTFSLRDFDSLWRISGLSEKLDIRV